MLHLVQGVPVALECLFFDTSKMIVGLTEINAMHIAKAAMFG